MEGVKKKKKKKENALRFFSNFLLLFEIRVTKKKNGGGADAEEKKTSEMIFCFASFFSSPSLFFSLVFSVEERKTVCSVSAPSFFSLISREQR